MISSNSDGNNKEIELNLTPIIDCFTVLITYLLLSASFINLGVLDVTVPISKSEDTPPQENSSISTPSVTLHFHQNHKIDLISSDEAVLANDTIPSRNQEWDFDSMAQTLNKLRVRFPDLPGILLTTDDEVKYQALIQIIEKVKAIFPQIAISPENTGL